jgi:type I restriction enzyme S subunit
MSGWKECKLGDVADVQNGYAFKSEYFKDFNGIPVIKIKNVASGKLDMNDVKYFQLSTKGLESYIIKKNDILIAMTGSHIHQPSSMVGKVARYNSEQEALLNQRVGKIYSYNEKKLNEDFLYYFLVQENITYELASNAGGSANQANISPSLIKSLDFLLPPLPEQKAIAEVLSCLDDKIDLLHRQNKTLESMAEALFRQWFVEETNDDLTTEVKIDDIVTIKGGTTPSTTVSDYWDGDVYWTTPRDLSNHNSVYLLNTERKITEKGLAQIGSGLLPVGSVLLSSRAPIGYLAITDIPVAINQGYIGIVCNKYISNYIIYLWCKENMELIENSGNGSVFQEIAKSTFKSITVAIPTIKVCDEFHKTIVPLFIKIKNNQYQIRTLEKLRDILLPKLMYGEVRVAG